MDNPVLPQKVDVALYRLRHLAIDNQAKPELGCVEQLRAHIAALTAENERLKQSNQIQAGINRGLVSGYSKEQLRLYEKTDEQKKRIAELTEALRFYARGTHIEDYEQGHERKFIIENGKIARAALASGEAEVCEICKGKGEVGKEKYNIVTKKFAKDKCSDCGATGRKESV
ncbi:hypothetical protein UFOVP826_33 [uncultured Caudovirales phage]|uniref:Uncharacterized protein n=1 Tax=uncultured Caudovirales phage TaxID=2100421 RepID=A0A6J5NZ71_9CAUD|nr:hypothetical protein UFOVP826_33 [uncultured Caudovirales phage]